MGTQAPNGATSGSSGTTASSPMQLPWAGAQQQGLGSLPQAGYYMNQQPSYYGPQSAPDSFARRSWAPGAPGGWQPSVAENYNTSANWTAPTTPAPGSNPVFAARTQERQARAAAAEAKAKADAAAAANRYGGNTWGPTGASGGPPRYPWLTPAEQAQMDAAHGGQMGSII